MFLGEYQHTLDAKGRVSLPAKFRAEMTGSLVVSKGLDNCLYVYSADEYRSFVEDLTLGNDFNSKQRHLRRFFVAGAQEVELDSAGRISLSPALRDYAGLKKEIAVTGNGNRIEIWDSEAWATYNSEAEGSIEDLAEGAGRSRPALGLDNGIPAHPSFAGRGHAATIAADRFDHRRLHLRRGRTRETASRPRCAHGSSRGNRPRRRSTRRSSSHTPPRPANTTENIVLLKGNFGDLDGLLSTAQHPVRRRIPVRPRRELPATRHPRSAASPTWRMRPWTCGWTRVIRALTAAEVIATYSEADLARIIRDFGEDRWATRIAAFIVAARARRPIETTHELVEVIKAAVPAAARREGPHPAKRTFQALRIEVNQELEVLRAGSRVRYSVAPAWRTDRSHQLPLARGSHREGLLR